MALGVGLLRLVRLRRKRKPKLPKPPNRRIIEGPLQLVVDKDGKEETIKCWVVLTSEWISFGLTRVDTPSNEIRINDIVAVYQKHETDEVRHPVLLE